MGIKFTLGCWALAGIAFLGAMIAGFFNKAHKQESGIFSGLFLGLAFALVITGVINIFSGAVDENQIPVHPVINRTSKGKLISLVSNTSNNVSGRGRQVLGTGHFDISTQHVDYYTFLFEKNGKIVRQRIKAKNVDLTVTKKMSGSVFQRVTRYYYDKGAAKRWGQKWVSPGMFSWPSGQAEPQKVRYIISVPESKLNTLR